jgi:L-alanine-DL-glutamate epimerase-like enolase superfamily enzyme
MKITRVETLIVRIDLLDRFGGQGAGPATLAGGLYHFEPEWNEVHPTVSQCVLVRVETDTGIHGWGECQAPIVPEAARAIIDQLLGPMIVGSDPHAVNQLWHRMYRSMAGRQGRGAAGLASPRRPLPHHAAALRFRVARSHSRSAGGNGEGLLRARLCGD